MTPTWLNDTVRAFGRQMGLAHFALDDRGVAGMRFENGLTLRLEYAAEALMMTVGVALPQEDRTMKALLAAVHPSARGPFRLRAAYLARTGEAIYAARLPERSVTVEELDRALRVLWQAAEKVRRGVQ